MQFITKIILLLLFSQIAIANSSDFINYNNPIDNISDSEMQFRLNNLNLCVQSKYNSTVKSYLKTYTVRDRQKASAILGRIVTYFPMFEKYLEERNMPKDLKYLAVVESALIPFATSRSSAKGLWQFMAPTARQYHLNINSLVDERLDPNKATQSALEYLSVLHKKFGNWDLALAAYNGGPGRVRKAIRKGKSHNYWKIKKYLPKETRNYVSAFIAASYLVNYYYYHDLQPNYPDMDMQVIESIKVYHEMTFTQISAITGVPIYTLQALNPSYKQNKIPRSYTGNYLIIPKRAIDILSKYVNNPDCEYLLSHVTLYDDMFQGYNPMNFFTRSEYTVQSGDDINKLATLFDCNIYNIRAWNNLPTNQISIGQKLIIFQPVASKSTTAVVASIGVSIPQKAVKKVVIDKYKDIHLKLKILDELYDSKFEYYTMKNSDSIRDVLRKYPNTSLKELMKDNDFKLFDLPNPGDRLKIRK